MKPFEQYREWHGVCMAAFCNVNHEPDEVLICVCPVPARISRIDCLMFKQILEQLQLWRELPQSIASIDSNLRQTTKRFCKFLANQSLAD